MNIEWNHNKLDSMYDFILINNEKFDSLSKMTDEVFDMNSVCAVRYTWGPLLYLMLERNESNRATLKKYIDENDLNLSFEFIHCSQLEEYILVQLLLNSMNRSDLEEFRFNNLAGRLFCIHPKWISKKSFKALEFLVDRDSNLKMNVASFTHISERNKIRFTNHRFESYPQYIFGNSQSLRKREFSPRGDAYIKRKAGTGKNRINFLELEKEKFDFSKVGLLRRVIEKYNKKFKEASFISFFPINIHISEGQSSKAKQRLRDRVCDLLALQKIILVDAIKNNISSKYLKEIQKYLESNYSIESHICDDLSRGCLNIHLIHDEEKYGELNEEDQYLQSADLTIQSITLESLENGVGTAIDVIVNELIIKQDLKDGVISIDDWSNRNYSEDMCFVMRDENSEALLGMNIHPDGSFHMTHSKIDPFSDNIDECVRIFATSNEREEDEKSIRGIIIKDNKNVNIICDTPLYTIPNYEEIHKILSKIESGSSGTRTKEFKNENMAACFDINYSLMNNEAYYYVGEKFQNPRTSLPNASRIRKISPCGDSTIFFDEIISLLSTSFVRYNRLTVMPFPFKYLREYKKTFAGTKEALQPESKFR